MQIKSSDNDKECFIN